MILIFDKMAWKMHKKKNSSFGRPEQIEIAAYIGEHYVPFKFWFKFRSNRKIGEKHPMWKDSMLNPPSCCLIFLLCFVK